LVINGSGDGVGYVDNLVLNDTTGERKMDWYVGNASTGTAVNLADSYQGVFNITRYDTMPLKFWFTFYFPLMGVQPSLSSLEYNVSWVV